jgi:hypothetical protein
VGYEGASGMGVGESDDDQPLLEKLNKIMKTLVKAEYTIPEFDGSSIFPMPVRNVSWMIEM